MRTHPWQIGLCGTFDVANYGDLLFPLIAESELGQRLGTLELHRFSYWSKTPPAWPYDVTSLIELPRTIARLDGLVVGGGFLIRFDKQVAPGYSPPDAVIHHPTGYWLTPALLALQHDVPLAWNAPGMDGNQIPGWAEPLVRAALTHSRYVSVRDEKSAAALERVSGVTIPVVPDTAFGVTKLLETEPSAQFTRFLTESGLDAPYIIVQPNSDTKAFARFVGRHVRQLRDFRFLALPIGPALGDAAATIDADLPSLVSLPYWPHPLVTAELIARSEAVVGHSYHMFVTALASGVPAFTTQSLDIGKFTGLQRFDTVHPVPSDQEPDINWFLARVGRTRPSAAAMAASAALSDHWDRMAAALQREAPATSEHMNRFWQSLPALLEDAVLGREQAVEAERAVARAEMQARDHRLTEMLASTSWRLTAPVRFVGSRLRGRGRSAHVLDVERIRRHTLETDPFRWAAITDLFQPDDAERLAASYPRDHFKLVSAFDGEKEYEYHARALIGMGASVVAYQDELSDSWRSLALDLLSPEYRAAMTSLTGYDLQDAPMEVNVFHYGPGGTLGPHRDLPEKLVTHVLYFNREWNSADGGCLDILRSAASSDVAARIPPLVGRSAIIVRSERSWHAVSRVMRDSPPSRRSMTVTFYRPGSVSTMWPRGDTTALHAYEDRE